MNAVISRWQTVAVLTLRLSWRHLRFSWGQTLALLIVLALGVSSYLAIAMANRAAVVSLETFAEAITGESDWVLRAPAGRIPLETLRELRTHLGTQPVEIIPVLETTAALPRQAGDPMYGRSVFQLLGLDLLAVGQLAASEQRNSEQSGGPANAFIDAAEGDDIWELLRNPRGVFIAETFGLSAGLESGDSLVLLLDDRSVSLEVLGYLPSDPARPQPDETLLVMDLAALAGLLGMPPEAILVDRVEFLAAEGFGLEERREQLGTVLQAFAGERYIVEAPENRRDRGQFITAAFRLNLTILSLIALVVGIYLMLQALDASVVRRREEIALLRSLGVSPTELRWAWQLEHALLGLAGSLVGFFLAWSLSGGAVQAVSQTVHALYQSSPAEAANPQWGDFLVALLLGTGCAVLGGWIPARDAAATPPAQILARGDRTPGLRLLRRPGLGLALVGLGGVAATLPAMSLAGGGPFPAAGYVAAFCWLTGGTLLTASLLAPLGRLGAVLFGRRHATWRLSTARLIDATSRHRLAAAGLFVATAMAAAMTILVGSFDHTMQRWVEVRLAADIYVSPDALQSASSQARLRDETVRAILADEEITEGRGFRVWTIEFQGQPTSLIGSDLSERSLEEDFIWIEAPTEPAAASAVPHAWISESFSRRFGVPVGEVLSLPTATGLREVSISGIYADYGNERGTLMIERMIAQDWMQESGLSGLALQVRAGVNVGMVADRLATTYPALVVRSQSQLRAEALRIFRQTFAVTGALKAIALIVALSGLALGLIILAWEQRPQLEVFRSLGMSRGEITRVTTCEGLGITLAGMGSGLIGSLALGWLLIYVINRQSFGWTLTWQMPWGSLATLALAIISTGALVSALVGWWGSKLPSEQHE